MTIRARLLIEYDADDEEPISMKCAELTKKDFDEHGRKQLGNAVPGIPLEIDKLRTDVQRSDAAKSKLAEGSRYGPA